MAINCAVDTPLLKELYNNVKDKVGNYQELKNLVTLWWDRESQKNPDFEYDVYPTPKEIDVLLKERTVPQIVESSSNNEATSSQEKDLISDSGEKTISYTPKGKRTQVYTIKGSHIYNRAGKEVFAKDSVDRNKIFANLAVKSGRAVVIEHNGNKYVVNNRDQIMSVQTGKIMQWDDTNGDRKAILNLAHNKANRWKTNVQESQPMTLSTGDAFGADSEWNHTARNRGIKSTRFSTKSYDELSSEDKSEADSEYVKAITALGKSVVSSSSYIGKLMRRNWLQVKNSDSVYAVGRILQPDSIGSNGYVNRTGHEVVDEGTGVAVQMAINNNKPVHVFDQEKNQWFVWDDGKFSAEDTPTLTNKFAGVGTRHLNDSGKAAIKAVFDKTLGTQDDVQMTPYSDEIDELILEQKGLKTEIDRETLEAKADIAFGTPQRRRDRINLIANAIRQNFQIEFNRQKKALQERINRETDTDVLAELHEQLDTLDERKAVELGMENILSRVRKMLSPNNSLNDYYNSEFQKIQDNWDILVDEVFDLLRVTEGLSLYSEEINHNDGTPIDDESGDFYDDDSQKEYGYKDGWMTKARFVDQRDSLSQKVRKIIWTTEKVNIDGSVERDDLGFKKYLQPDMVQSVLLQELSQARNVEHFWEILNNLAKKKKWVAPLIERLENDEEVKSQFYQNFRKEFMPYWIQVKKEIKSPDGEVISSVIQTKRVNKVPGIMHMLDEWRDNYEEGSKLDEYSVYSEGQQINRENAQKASDFLAELQDNFPDDVGEWLDNDENLNKVMRVLHMAGISVDSEVVRETMKGTDEDGASYLDTVYQSLSTIFNGIIKGEVKETILSDGTVEYNDLLNTFDKAYTKIARTIDTIPEESVLSSFRESGKSYQSYSAPSYLGKLINNLKNLSGTAESLESFFNEQFKKYRWFYTESHGWRNSWLRQLYESRSKRDLLDRKIVMHSGKLEFNDWGNLEYAIAMISEFNSTMDSNSAWYYIPLLADAESAEFIKFTRYTNSSETDESGNPIPYEKLVLRDLEDAVRQEYDRIMLVRQREGRVNPIANFDIIREKDGSEKGTIKDASGNIISRNSGNEFKFFPALNTYKVNGRLFIDVLEEKILNNDSDVSSFIQEALNNVLEEGYAKFRESIAKAGALRTSDEASTYFQVKDSELESLMRNFYWNNALAQSQIIQLTTTDISYYKDMKDFQKRFKEIYAQTLKLNTEATFNGEKVGSSTGKVLYLKDSIIKAPSFDALEEMLESRVQAGELTSMDKDALLNHYKGVNVADAQAFRSLNSYRKVMVMAGRWTQEMEDCMNRLRNGTWTMNDFNVIWQTLKPFAYTQGARPSGVDGWGDIKVPVQYKNSEFLLLAIYNTISTPIQESGKLRAINAFMEDNDIDMVMFESAVKAGNQGVIDLSEADSYEDVLNVLSSSVKGNNGEFSSEVVHEFDYEDYGIQVETPEHMIDKYQLFGTQLRKLIASDIDPDAEISVMGSKPMKKSEWWIMYNDLITANVADSYNEAADEFSSIEHIAEIIQSELKGNTRYSDEIRKACELIEVTNPLTGETEKVFNLPLYDPVQSERVQHLLNSIIKKKVTKQTIKGGTGIQVSAYGLTDQLKIVWEGEGENKRMKYMECYLPAYSKEFLEPLIVYKTVNGQQVGELDITKLPDELRRIIGYRV